MLKLIQTCHACPEQYDVFNEEGIQVGYLRLRWGHFYAQCYVSSFHHPTVYEADTIGDGLFDSSERTHHLNEACKCIIEELNKEKEPPSLYTIEYK